MLEIFGNTIDKVFPNTEVLALHNVCGEGISLTHEEQEFMCAELRFFPHELSKFLLKKTHNKLSLVTEALLQDFVVWLLCVHPLSGKSRLCNKLISLLQQSTAVAHEKIFSEATHLQKKIENSFEAVYATLLVDVPDLSLVVKSAMKFQPEKSITNQTTLTGIPKWCGILL